MENKHTFEDQKKKEERKRKRTVAAAVVGIVVVAAVVGLLLRARGAEQDATFTVGVVNVYASMGEIIEGFKAGMAELGYVEGENVTYIYNSTVGADSQAINAEIESLLAQEVDLLLTLSSQVTLRTQQAVEGADVPVLFVPVLDPVGLGLVESLSHPGGNLTGIQFTNAFPKAVEQLLMVAPETTQVYVPYIAVDATTAPIAEIIGEAAVALGVEAVVDEAQSLEEVIAAIETLPEDAAIFSPPSPALATSDFVGVATERGIAVGSILKTDVEIGALVSFGIDSFSMGEQAAHLAGQVFQGIAPADLPVETAEHYLSINLRTAEAIGLDVPDTILRQAETIIR